MLIYLNDNDGTVADVIEALESYHAAKEYTSIATANRLKEVIKNIKELECEHSA